MATLKYFSSYFHLSRYNNLSVRDKKVVHDLAAFYHIIIYKLPYAKYRCKTHTA